MGFPSWSSSTRHLSFRCPRALASSSRNESHVPHRGEGAKTGEIFRATTSPRRVQRARGACARRGPYRPADRTRPRRGCLRHARWRRVSTSPEGEASGSDPRLRASPSADVRRPPRLESRCGAAPEASLPDRGPERRLLPARRLAGTRRDRSRGLGVLRTDSDGLARRVSPARLPMSASPWSSMHCCTPPSGCGCLRASRSPLLASHSHRGTPRGGRPRSALREHRHHPPGRSRGSAAGLHLVPLPPHGPSTRRTDASRASDDDV
jgi:hypothetical protein